MHLQPLLSSLYTLDMFPALVGFVVSVVDIHWRLVSYELHHKLCCTCVWSRFKPMLQPDQNLRKLVNPKENDWLLICLQPFYRVLSSGCIESAEQPSLMEKGSRMTVLQHDNKRTAHMILSPPPYRHTCTAWGWEGLTKMNGLHTSVS